MAEIYQNRARIRHTVLATATRENNGEDLGRAGDMDLLAEISERVRPLYHMFGHTHHGYGFSADGTTRFVNASICDGTYYPSQPPMCFDLPSRERFG
eukprot:COSAG02_NODE_5110_length_4620_cov_1.897810_5_plen_97_part_00